PSTSDVGGQASGSFAPQALIDGILKPKEDVGAYRSQLVDCLSGKILRIDPVTGNGVPRNPYFDVSNPRSARSLAWALGLRIPFRVCVRPETGRHDPADGDPGVLYVGDVGWNTTESLRVITGPRQNSGWPVFEGYDPPAGYDVDIPNQDAPNPLPRGGMFT